LLRQPDRLQLSLQSNHLQAVSLRSARRLHEANPRPIICLPASNMFSSSGAAAAAAAVA